MMVPKTIVLPITPQDKCGRCRIRTYGTLRYAGFQDQCIRPLCQSSNIAGYRLTCGECTFHLFPSRYYDFFVNPTGFEPVTVCLEGRCSIQLSYESSCWEGGTRTPKPFGTDLQSVEPTNCSTSQYMRGASPI